MNYIFIGINIALSILFFLCYSYQFFYQIVPFLFKPKPHKKTELHKFAILVSARNEENVIGNLLDSINAQDYDRKMIKTFVIADNCTDKTAEVAKNHRALVYERNDLSKCGKGYALEFVFNKLKDDNLYNDFDAFLILDADNIIKPNYITEMNKTFSDGFELASSYRNSKNYGDNWISAGYGLWFLRESVYLNYSRLLLGTSSAFAGTGFYISRKVMDMFGGWKFFLLTEDIELVVTCVTRGIRIGYSKDAEFFDEQPTSFSQSWKQRLRWCKGYLQVWRHLGKDIIKGVFSKYFFTCFDMSMIILPAMLISIGTVLNVSIGLLLDIIFKENPVPLLISLAFMALSALLTVLIIGAITTITEWKKIHTTKKKKILYIFTFPIFMLTYLPISMVAIFKKVKWEHIDHTESKNFNDIIKDGE